MIEIVGQISGFDHDVSDLKKEYIKLKEVGKGKKISIKDLVKNFDPTEREAL